MNNSVSNPNNSANPISGPGGQGNQSGPSGTEPEFSLPLQSASPSPSLVGQSPDHNGSVSDFGQERRRLAPGTELSDKRYSIERLAGIGGMGAVYLATDRRFNKPCAVKEMLDSSRTESERMQSIEWFSREASLLIELNHQCIPHVRDFFTDSGRHYLVMDFIKGRTMSEVAERDTTVVGPNGIHGISESRARNWAQQLCSVFGYLHSQTPPIIFRDLKPSNIMVTENDTIKLIDFGIARPFQSQSQATVIMTHGYAPQEQVLGAPEPRSDIYALGATLFRVMTHHDPSNNKPNVFTFPSLRLLRPDVSPAFEQVVMKALALFPEQRWASAAEMGQAIVSLPPPGMPSNNIVGVFQPLDPTRVVNPNNPNNVVGPATPQNPGNPNNLAGPNTPGNLSNPNTPQKPTSGPALSSLNASLVPGAGANPARPVSPPMGVNGPAGSLILATSSQLAANRIDEAYLTVQRAHTLEPNNALVHKLFGQIFARRQQIDFANQAYLRSIQLNSEDAETHKLLGDVWFFLRKQPQSAIAAYIQSLRLNPKDYESHQRLAQCYEQTNQLELSLREYQEAIRLAPKQSFAPLYFALGQVAMRLGQLTVAEHAFVQILMINPGDHHTRFLLSQAYERQNKLEDAFRECGYVVGPLGQSNPAVTTMYQRLRAQLGR